MPATARLCHGEQHGQRQAHDGSGDSNEEFRLGARRFRANLSHATKDEQRDAAHRHLEPQGDHRMSQFVEQYTPKEHDRSGGAHEPIQKRRPVPKLGGIVTARQHPGEQRKNQEPGIIQTNGDSHYPAQRNIVPGHESPSRSGTDSQAGLLAKGHPAPRPPR